MQISQQIRGTGAWKLMQEAVFKVKSWFQRTIWGERMFLKFEGPAVVLLQSRTGRLRDLVSVEEAGEWASAKNGDVHVAAQPTPAVEVAENVAAAQEVVQEARGAVSQAEVVEEPVEKAPKVQAAESAVFSEPVREVRATVPRGSPFKRVIVENGKARFEDSDFKEFRR